MKTIVYRSNPFFLPLFIIILCTILPLLAKSFPSINSNSLNYSEYYEFLKGIKSSSAEERIEQLKSYLIKHSSFDRIYVQLLEEMLYNGQLQDAKRYFQNRITEDKHAHFSHWMLAKIFVAQDSINTAYREFQLALKADKIPYWLIRDFVEFLNQSGSVFSSKKEIEALNLNLYQKNTAYALWYFQNREWSKTIEQILSSQINYYQDNALLHLLATCYYSKGANGMATAISFYQKGLDLAKLRNDEKFKIYNLVGLGRTNRTENRRSFEEALIINEEINDLTLSLLSKFHIAGLYRSQRNYQEALLVYKNLAKIAISIGNWRKAALIFRAKARTLISLQWYNDVLPAFEKAEKFAQKCNDKSELFSIYLSKGDFYNTLSLDSLASHEYKKVYEIAKLQGFKNVEYRAIARYADLLMKKEKFQNARERYSEWLERFLDTAGPNYIAYWRYKIFMSYYLEKNYDNAYKKFTEYWESIKSQTHNNYINRIKAFYRLKIADMEVIKGRYRIAMDIYNEDTIVNAAEKHDVAIERNYGLGNVYKGLQDLDSAITFYRKAVKKTEESQASISVEQFKIGHFSQYIDPYNALIQCLLTQYKNTGDPSRLDSMFHYMEISRSRTLRDLRLKEGYAKDQPNTPEYKAYQNASLELQALQRQIRLYPFAYDSLYSRYKLAQYQLMDRRLQLANQPTDSTGVQVLPLDTLKKNLQNVDMSLLMYHVSEQGSFTMVIQNETVEIVPIEFSADSLTGLVDSLIAPFNDLGQKTLAKIPFKANIAHRLYKLLITPIENTVSLNKELIIVPDGGLRRLPFEMLLTNIPRQDKYFPTDTVNYSKDFMLNRYAILYSPTTWLFREKSKTFSWGGTKILVLANPMNMDGEDLSKFRGGMRANWRFLPPLWYADSEGNAIKNIHERTSIFKRKNATMERLSQEMKDHQILHFATHAFVDSVFDTFSGLLLAMNEDSTEDGLLMGYEIARWQHNWDLVTLSACETSQGKLVAGEGVLGLPRLFLGAGARRVLMTHWQVSDQFTPKLMVNFYNSFLNEGLSKPNALQVAKQAMFSAHNLVEGQKVYYEHPLFWAPFVLYGEPEAPLATGGFMNGIIILVAGAFGLLILAIFILRRRASSNRRFVTD